MDGLGRYLSQATLGPGVPQWEITVEERNFIGTLRHQYVFGPRIDEVILRDDNLLADYAEQAGGGEAPTNLALLVESCPPPDLLVLPPDVGEAVPPCPAARRLWYHLDDQMSTVLITNDDGVGIEGYEYTPYGKPVVYPATVTGVNWAATGTLGGTGSYANRVTYTGRSWEAATGLHYYRTRYMSPDQGRFTSSDTIGVWGDSASLGNGYAYGANHPSSSIDPSGQIVAFIAGYPGQQFEQDCSDASDWTNWLLILPGLMSGALCVTKAVKPRVVGAFNQPTQSEGELRDYWRALRASQVLQQVAGGSDEDHMPIYDWGEPTLSIASSIQTLQEKYGGPLILIGHSFGAQSALQVSHALDQVCIDMGIALDRVSDTRFERLDTWSISVRSARNIYAEGNSWSEHTTGQDRPVGQFNQIGLDTTHGGILDDARTIRFAEHAAMAAHGEDNCGYVGG